MEVCKTIRTWKQNYHAIMGEQNKNLLATGWCFYMHVSMACAYICTSQAVDELICLQSKQYCSIFLLVAFLKAFSIILRLTDVVFLGRVCSEIIL